MTLRAIITAAFFVALFLSACTLPGVTSTPEVPSATPTDIEIILPTLTPTLDPSGPIISRGVEYYESGELLLALDEFNQAIALNPDSYAAHFQRGRVLTDIDDYGSALADFERALAVDPTRAEAFNGRGVVRTKLGDYEAALKDFGLAIIIMPDYSEAFSNRGITYVQMGELETGISDFTYALGLQPDNVDAYYNRALAYAILGNKQSEEDFRKVLELSDDPELRRVATDYLEGSGGNP